MTSEQRHALADFLNDEERGEIRAILGIRYSQYLSSLLTVRYLDNGGNYFVRRIKPEGSFLEGDD